MTEDLTLSDLKEEQDAQIQKTGDDSGGGEWVETLIDRLDERGYLDLMIQQQFGIPAEQTVSGSGGGSGDTEAASDGGTPGEVDAATVSRFGRMVLDQVGDVPISQVVTYAENHEDVVDQMIDQAIQAENQDAD